MAQSNKVFNSTNQSLKSEVDVEKAVSYNKETTFDTVSTVSIQLMIDATLKITGTVTGLQYVFHGAGAIVDVDFRDKDELLNKKRGNSCCGGQSGKSIFALV